MDTINSNQPNNSSITTPQHPLPKEIRSMPRDETVCKYCGISYLIHAEVKALQDRLEKTEEELKSCKNARNMVEKLTEDLEYTQKIKDNLQDQLQKEQLICSNRTLELEASNRQLNSVRSAVKRTQESVSCLKKEVLLLKSIFMEYSNNHKTCVQTLMSEFVNQFESIEKDMKSKIEDLNIQLNASNYECTTLQQKISNIMKDHERTVAEMLLKYEDNDQRLSAQVTRLEVELSTQKLDMENELSLRKHDEDLLKHRYDENIKENEIKIESLITEQRRNIHEISELQNKVLDLQSSLSTAKDEVLHQKHLLKQVTGEFEALKLKGEEVEANHEMDLKTLEDGYEKRLKSLINENKKLKDKLLSESERHSADMSELESRLQNEFQIALANEAANHKQNLMQVIEEETLAQQKLMLELENAREATSQSVTDVLLLRNQLNEARESTAALENENSSLRSAKMKMIKTIETYEASLPEVNETISAQTTKVSALEKELAVANDKLSDLERELLKSISEVEFLRDTVRQECEERRELSEALARAKHQLMILNKPPGGYSHLIRSPVLSSDIDTEGCRTSRNSLQTIINSDSSLTKPRPPSLQSRRSVIKTRLAWNHSSQS